ncbi:MAG: FimB/Mfa2 family fimbrial subunit [Bacteroidaceae bacterium]|nr:FimB/Mfa2 family fimbrial subunit [Bacteroidaceae bacterium]
MKRNSIFAGIILCVILLATASCSNENETLVDNNALAPVRVHVSGFNVSQEDFPETRAAQNVANYSGINAVMLAFYEADGTEAYKRTQAKTDADFGEFSLSLPMGTYTMVALAYYYSDNSPLSLTSPTVASFTGSRAFETFAATQEVTISNTNAVDISATLSRIIAQLKVVSTDGKTADVTNVRMTLSAGGKDFNPSTGFATVNTGIANMVGNSADVGANSTSSTFLFLITDEQNINVTIETLDADGAVLFSKTVSNVPFQRNRVTKLSGAMYTNTAVAGSFQVSTEWISEHTMDF